MSMVTDTPQLSDPEQQHEPPKHAHIIKTEPGESAAAKVTEARVLGTPLEALCGEIFVPQHRADTLPMCSKCEEIYRGHRYENDGLHERPNDNV